MANAAVITATVTAVIGLIGAATGAIIQGYNATALERQKFEASLVLKALEPEEASQRIYYLLFLIEAGLLSSLNVDNIRSYSEKPESLPRSILNVNADFTIQSLFEEGGKITGLRFEADDTWREQQYFRTHRVMANRDFGNGRIVAVAHDGMLVQKNSEQFLSDTFKWLSKHNEQATLSFTTGHCEWVPTRSREKSAVVKSALQSRGYTVGEIPGLLTAESLRGTDVLVIGNAPGSITASELDAIESFVAKGGGLFLAGLGWSWKPDYCPKPKVENNIYPMNAIGRRFGVEWLKQ